MGMFKKAASKIIDLRVDRWMSLSYLGETFQSFQSLTRDMVIPKKAQYSETFEQAMARLELTEQDINDRKKEFIRLFYFFIALGTVVIFYGLYLAYQGLLLPALISFCLAFYSLTQAFRFHFWHFQMKYRKLGCTVSEWMNSKIYTQTTPNQEITPAPAPSKHSDEAP